MKDEFEPISSDETVLRLIWTDYFDPSLTLAVQPGAFAPKKNETTGISVFRAQCLGDPLNALKVIEVEKRNKYAIAVLRMEDLALLGLSVTTSKIDALPGHCLVPELNIESVKADKARWRDITKKLAVLASQNVIANPRAGTDIEHS